MIKKYIVLAVFVAVASLFHFGQRAQASSAPTCERHNLTVTLSASDPAIYNLAGWLCYKDSLQDKTVQLLVHGLTYDHNYWDFPLQPEDYSYVLHATNAGYATFNIDRLGVGLSDRPANALSLTVQSAAHVANQVVQALRGGQVANHPFAKVMSVGHSFGSQVVIYEAATYADVDGVVVTGLMHEPGLQALTTVLPSLYPAQLDLKFLLNVPVGYVTTLPGMRGPDFYNTAIAEQAVINKDEELKQTATLTEMTSLAEGGPLSQNIHVPVLLVMGQKDIIFCDILRPCQDAAGIAAREAQHFAPDACLETFVLPNAGHSINLHPNAHDWMNAGIDWANRRVGPNTNPPGQPC